MNSINLWCPPDFTTIEVTLKQNKCRYFLEEFECLIFDSLKRFLKEPSVAVLIAIVTLTTPSRPPVALQLTIIHRNTWSGHSIYYSQNINYSRTHKSTALWLEINPTRERGTDTINNTFSYNFYGLIKFELENTPKNTLILPVSSIRTSLPLLLNGPRRTDNNNMKQPASTSTGHDKRVRQTDTECPLYSFHKELLFFFLFFSKNTTGTNLIINQYNWRT